MHRNFIRQTYRFFYLADNISNENYSVTNSLILTFLIFPETIYEKIKKLKQTISIGISKDAAKTSVLTLIIPIFFKSIPSIFSEKK